MMDVEKLKQVNELTGELKKHNIASMYDDAYNTAKTFVMDKELDEMNNEETNIAQNQVPEYKKALEIHMERVERKFSNAVTNLMQKTDERLNNLSNDIEKLKKENQELRSRLNQSNSPQQPIQQKLEQVENPKQEKCEEGNQRGGDISPEEVAIDKIFYFGKK